MYVVADGCLTFCLVLESLFMSCQSFFEICWSLLWCGNVVVCFFGRYCCTPRPGQDCYDHHYMDIQGFDLILNPFIGVYPEDIPLFKTLIVFRWAFQNTSLFLFSFLYVYKKNIWGCPIFGLLNWYLSIIQPQMTTYDPQSLLQYPFILHVFF